MRLIIKLCLLLFLISTTCVAQDYSVGTPLPLSSGSYTLSWKGFLTPKSSGLWGLASVTGQYTSLFGYAPAVLSNNSVIVLSDHTPPVGLSYMIPRGTTRSGILFGFAAFSDLTFKVFQYRDGNFTYSKAFKLPGNKRTDVIPPAVFVTDNGVTLVPSLYSDVIAKPLLCVGCPPLATTSSKIYLAGVNQSGTFVGIRRKLFSYKHAKNGKNVVYSDVVKEPLTISKNGSIKSLWDKISVARKPYVDTVVNYDSEDVVLSFVTPHHASVNAINRILYNHQRKVQNVDAQINAENDCGRFVVDTGTLDHYQFTQTAVGSVGKTTLTNLNPYLNSPPYLTTGNAVNDLGQVLVSQTRSPGNQYIFSPLANLGICQ